MTQYVLICDSDDIPTTNNCTGSEYWVKNSADLTLLTEINEDAFIAINGWLLISFLVGHCAGRIVKWLGKK